MNKAAKCRELIKKLYTQQCGKNFNLTDVNNLKKKIFGKENGFTMDVSTATLRKMAESLDAQVNKCIHLQSLERINEWKNKMRNDSQARAGWINKKYSCNSHVVGTPESPTADWEQGAERLRSYWKELGEKVKMSPPEREEVVTLIAGKLKPLLEGCSTLIGRPGYKDFMLQLRRIKGCAGMDGWSKPEIKTILQCEHFVREIWEEMSAWEELGVVPTSIRDIRVACLAKENKINENTLKPEHHRPISVQSVFRRAWSATWLKSKQVDNWRRMLFPKNISGGYPGAWGPELPAAITHEYLLRWKFAVSLDFSHAFDTINVKMVQEALLCILPSGCHAWITLLTEHWMNLRQWFCFDGHIHQNVLTTEVGIPQGDPASPLIMTILLRVGYGLVEESLKDHCFQAIYMDDRAVVTNSWEKVLLAQQTWANFAEKIHMIENHTKAQLVDVEGNNGKSWCDHLGVCIGKPSADDFRTFPKNVKRLEEAKRVALRAGILPLGTSGKMQTVNISAKSKATYGWLFKDPFYTQIRAVNTASWRAIGRLLYGVKELKKIVAGAHLHLDASLKWRLIRLTEQTKFALHAIGADFSPADMCNRVENILQNLQWEKDGNRWRHIVFPEGFFLHDVLENNSWRKISHFLRVSWRHLYYHELANSPRHELNGQDTELPPWDNDRINLVKEWSQQHGGKLTLSIGAMMSGRVRLLGPSAIQRACPGCNSYNYHWDHLWNCLLNMDPPKDVLLRRFLWPRSRQDFQMIDTFFCKLNEKYFD